MIHGTVASVVPGAVAAIACDALVENAVSAWDTGAALREGDAAAFGCGGC